MGCLISCPSKNHHHRHNYSSTANITTDDSTAALAHHRRRRCPPTGCRPKKKSDLFPSRPPPQLPAGTKTRRSSAGRNRRRRVDDSIPKLPKTFFAIEMEKNNDGEEEDTSLAVTPSTTEQFSMSVVSAADWSESPVHWGIWRRKEVHSIPLASELNSFVGCHSPTPVAKSAMAVELTERQPAAEEQRRSTKSGRGTFRKDLGNYRDWSPAAAMASFAMRSPARGGSSSGWSGRAIGSGVKIHFINDDVCLKRWEQGDQSIDGGSHLSMECFVF